MFTDSFLWKWNKPLILRRYTVRVLMIWRRSRLSSHHWSYFKTYWQVIHLVPGKKKNTYTFLNNTWSLNWIIKYRIVLKKTVIGQSQWYFHQQPEHTSVCRGVVGQWTLCALWQRTASLLQRLWVQIQYSPEEHFHTN